MGRDYSSIELPKMARKSIKEPTIDKRSADKTPMAIVKEIEDNPTPEGVLKTTIWGIPVDLHSLESFIPKISPHVLRTIVRNDRGITIERMKNYAPKKPVGLGGGLMWLLVIGIILAIVGVFVMMFMPEIMAMFGGG